MKKKGRSDFGLAWSLDDKVYLPDAGNFFSCRPHIILQQQGSRLALWPRNLIDGVGCWLAMEKP
jgi:hypothetical protein